MGAERGGGGERRGRREGGGVVGGGPEERERKENKRNKKGETNQHVDLKKNETEDEGHVGKKKIKHFCSER